MKTGIKPKYKRFIFELSHEEMNCYCGKMLYGESPIGALVKHYSGEYYDNNWGFLDALQKHKGIYVGRSFSVKLHFFPHNGRVRCNAEIFFENELRKVDCWRLPSVYLKKNWNKWEDYWFVVSRGPEE